MQLYNKIVDEYNHFLATCPTTPVLSIRIESPTDKEIIATLPTIDHIDQLISLLSPEILRQPAKSYDGVFSRHPILSRDWNTLEHIPTLNHFIAVYLPRVINEIYECILELLTHPWQSVHLTDGMESKIATPNLPYPGRPGHPTLSSLLITITLTIPPVREGFHGQWVYTPLSPAGE